MTLPTSYWDKKIYIMKIKYNFFVKQIILFNLNGMGQEKELGHKHKHDGDMRNDQSALK